MPPSSPPPPPLLLLLFLLISLHWAEGGGLLSSSSSSPTSSSSTSSSSSSSRPGYNGPAEPSGTSPEPDSDWFSLQVLVLDWLTRRPLSGSWVSVYQDGVLRSSSPAGETGEVLLRAPFSRRAPLTLLGHREGHVPQTLSWTPNRRPVFSSVTLLLLPYSQGNVWLFDDSLLITGKSTGSVAPPTVRFPESLLGHSESSNGSSLTAFISTPQQHLERNGGHVTTGVLSSKTGEWVSVDLRPVASVSVLLYSGSQQLQVRGPIHISLPLGPRTRLRASDTVPAWSFNNRTGTWENQGLGIIRSSGAELVWTYTASHLGDWMAAPLPSSSRGFLSQLDSLDFLTSPSFLLVAVVGGVLLVVIGFLSLLLCHCRVSRWGPRPHRARFSRLTVSKKDQTTSTHLEEGLLFGSGEAGLVACGVQSDSSSTPRHKANFNIYVEEPGARPGDPLYQNLASQNRRYINSEEAARLREKTENLNTDNFFPDKLVHLYNSPAALLHQPDALRCATFPRNGCDPEPASKESYTQTLPKAPHHHTQGGGIPRQGGGDEPQPLETPPPGHASAAVWSRYTNLLESSVSVPGTLNEAAGVEAFSGSGIPGELQGVSERTLLELTRGRPSSSHSRAWFVSLDGRPAAQVRHSVIELQGRRRRPSSNDTSLDSGVDMNELQHSGREAERPSTRATSLPHHGRATRCGEEADLSSSESGTTATCTPEDPALRNILDGSSGAITNIPEERDGVDTSSAQEDSESRETPPPRRLRKVRDRPKSDKRSGKNLRDNRAMNKRS